MVNIYVLTFFEHLKKVCEPYIILKETDAKLKKWSKFGISKRKAWQVGSSLKKHGMKTATATFP